MAKEAAEHFNSRPIFKNRITLRTRHAQKTYARAYRLLASAVYAMSLKMRAYATEQQASQVEEAVDAIINEAHGDLTQEIARMRQMCAENGLNPDDLEYTDPREYVIDLSSNRAQRYLDMIRDLDDLCVTMDMLGIGGVLSDSQHSTGEYQWQRRVHRISSKVRTMCEGAVKKAASAKAKRDAKETGKEVAEVPQDVFTSGLPADVQEGLAIVDEDADAETNEGKKEGKGKKAENEPEASTGEQTPEAVAA